MAWTVRVSNTYSGIALSMDEMKGNAWEIYGALSALGWSFLSICGALGNMQKESYLNPGAVENNYPIPAAGSIKTPGGLGLIQWTDYPPYTATKNHPLLWNANRAGVNWYSGNYQCQLLNMATDPTATDCGEGEGPRWGWLTGYWGSMSFADFKALDYRTQTPEYAAECFYYYMEMHGPDNGTLPERRQNARFWYDYLMGQDPEPPTPPTPDPDPDEPPIIAGHRNKWVYYLSHPNYKL